MKHWKVGSVALLVLVMAVSGCAKKSTEQASITGTGFDSLSSTEELAQLPSTSTVNQQGSVEVLPIETSPITQGIPPIAGPSASQTSALTQTPAAETVAKVAGALTRDQQIQTALKAAGLYSGNIDGKIGPATRRAIQEFQRQNSLKADGKVGPKTWAAMEHYLSGAPETQTQTSVDQ